MLPKKNTIILAALMLGVPAALLAQQDPFIGSWKSKKGATINKYEDAGGGKLKVTVTGVDKAGQPTVHSRIEEYDGKPNKVEGEDGTDAISVKRIDPHTIEGDNWLDGKPRAHFTVTVSPDGKTLTKKIKGTNKDGQAYEDVRVSDKMEEGRMPGEE